MQLNSSLDYTSFLKVYSSRIRTLPLGLCHSHLFNGWSHPPTHSSVPFRAGQVTAFLQTAKQRYMRFDADISTSIYIPNDVYSLWSFLNHMSSLLCDGSLEGSNVINTDLRYMSFYLNCSIEMIHVFSKYWLHDV